MAKQNPPREFDNFTDAVDKLLSVPKAELLRREAEYKKNAAQNPRKRGPKPRRAAK